MKNAKQLWQEYFEFIERNFNEKSNHLSFILYSVAWLKSNYQSFQKVDIERIINSEIFNYNFMHYAVEHQEFSAWQIYLRQKNCILNDKEMTFRHLKFSSLIDWIECLCREELFPTLMCDCPHFGNWRLKPQTDSKNNVGFFCEVCMQDFSNEPKLTLGEFAKPMTLHQLDEADLKNKLF